MKRSTLVPLIGILALAMVYAVAQRSSTKRPKTPPKLPPIAQRPHEPTLDEPKPEIKHEQPAFIDWPPVRRVSNQGRYLSDISSHLPAGNIYEDTDKVTSGHEQTHGINSNIRQKFPKGNGFYCLDDKASTCQEPPLRLSAVAKKVPKVLRGAVYNLYLVQQARYWDAQPLYVLDELKAYEHGTLVGVENNLRREESGQYMAEFLVYALSLASAIDETNSKIRTTGSAVVPPTITEFPQSKVIEVALGLPQVIHPSTTTSISHEMRIVTQPYDDRQFKAYLRWCIDGAIKTFKSTEGNSMENRKAAEYLTVLRTSKDTEVESLRQFVREYLSSEWVRQTLEF